MYIGMVTMYPKYVLKPANVDLGCYNVIDTPPCSWTFAPVGFSMQLPMVSETQCTIPKFLLVSVGNVFTPLVSVLFIECKLHDMQTQAMYVQAAYTKYGRHGKYVTMQSSYFVNFE